MPSTDAPDPAVLRAERRLQLLEELTAIGMNLARTLERHVLAAAQAMDAAASPDGADALVGHAPPPAPLSFDPSVAFARISRAIRLTLALETRTDEALRALRAGIAAECKVRRAEARDRATVEAAARSKARRDTVERLVIEAAEREIQDDEALCEVFEALEQRLEEDRAYQNLDQAPLREIVQRLCADLELNPDWDRWEGEAWAPQAPFSRPRASVWARPSRRPLRPLDAAPRRAEAAAPRTHQLE